MREIVVDNFAGGGGASTGIEIAIGRSVDIAINHDPAAIAMHKVNHPDTKHYTEDVWAVDPVEACEGRPVALAWFSPDCFPAGTLILTADGYKSIEDIRVGDMVLTHMGRWRAVTATMTSFKQEIELVGTGHYGIRCSKGHPFLIMHRPHKGHKWKRVNEEPTWVKAEAIGKDDYWGIPITVERLPIPEMQKVSGKARVLPVDERLMWLAGRYVGDGWVRRTDTRGELVIVCGSHEKDFLTGKLNMWPRSGERVKDNEIAWAYRDVRTGGQFTCNSFALADWLVENFGTGAGEKTIPAWLYGAEENLKRQFLDGYIGADGCKSKNGLIQISTISKKLACGIKTLVGTLGYSPAFYFAEQNSNVIEGREVNVHPIYSIRWRENVDEEHCEFVKDSNILWQKIRKVTDCNRRSAFFNISVDEDESYVAEGIIVHNCKHFSKAKGSKPVSNKIRGLAWVAVKWAKKVRPRVIMLENVEEFQDWGRLRKEDSKPDPAYKGETFKRFVKQLEHLGYHVEYRLLRACDYGAPTTRKRFFLIARCDNRPIVWPEPTHGDPDSIEVLTGLKKPWVPVSECIDWSIPCPSIFATSQEIYEQYGIRAVRPLAKNTLKRIAAGIEKFKDKPFLIQYHQSSEFRGQSTDEPLMTVDASNRYGLCMTFITQFNNHCKGTNPDEPIPTLTAKSNHFGLCKAFLTSYYGNGSQSDVSEPMPTQTGHDRFGLVQVYGNEYQIADIGLRMLTPRELFDAQGFPHDYIIDHDADGNDYPRSEQVAKCGNAVCPPIPTALVRANLPELCSEEAT